MAKVNNYQAGRQKAREKAINWQYDEAKKPMSWYDFAVWCEYFYKLGKRYGLIREFRENGII